MNLRLLCVAYVFGAEAQDVFLSAKNGVAVASTSTDMPCDIFANAGTPCVAAHSTVRALYSSGHGPLYQVKRSDGKTMDIMALNTSSWPYADSVAQDEFCSGKKCVIQRIYDQSPNGNHLDPPPTGINPVDAQAHKVVMNGHPVYGVFTNGRQGYHNGKTKGVAKNNDPETIYMVTSGKHYNGECCFDYGNTNTNNVASGAGSMEAIYFGNAHWSRNTKLCDGKSCPVSGDGSGPWVGADIENGMYYGGQQHTKSNTPLTFDFVTAMLKGGTNGMALKGGDATTGKLKTMYDGPRPAGRYEPMRKQGGIGLAIGGDTGKGKSNKAIGIFYEGVMTHGYTTDATDDAVQANIVAAGYGKSMFTV